MSLSAADDRSDWVRGLICRSLNRHNPTVAASIAATHLRCRPQSRPPRLDGCGVSGIKDPTI